jgi:hypothetical protein
MKIASSFILIFFSVLITPSYAKSLSAEPEELGDEYSYRAFNLAHTQCNKITKNSIKKESISVALKLWLGGYFSAMNSLSSPNIDLLNGASLDQVILELVHICEKSGEKRLLGELVFDYLVDKQKVKEKPNSKK